MVTKNSYIHPTIDIMEYKVEEGYATSMELPQTEFVGDICLDNEEVVEGECYNKEGWDENDWF